MNIFLRNLQLSPHHRGQLDHTGSNPSHDLTMDGNPSLSPDGGIACRFSVHTSLEGRREDLPFTAPPGPAPPGFPAPPQLPPLRPPPPPPPVRPPPPPPPPPPISEHVVHESGGLRNMLQSVFVDVNMLPPEPPQISGERRRQQQMRLFKEWLESVRRLQTGFTQAQLASAWKMSVSKFRRECKKVDVHGCFKKEIDLEVQKQAQAGRDALRTRIKRLEQEIFGDQLYADSREIGLAGDKCDTDIFILSSISKVVIVKDKKLTGSSESSADRVKEMVEVRLSNTI